MKYLKLGLYSLGGLIAIVIIALTIFVFTFDPNSHKDKFTSFVKERFQRNLSIEGNIKLSIFPTIGLNLGKTTLSEVNSGTLFSSLDSARISIELFPLLRKELVIDEIRISGLRANLIRYKNGKTNIDDLYNLSSQESNHVKEQSPSQKVRFDIDDITLTDADVTWDDRFEGRKLAVNRFNLKTGKIANRADGKIELSAIVVADKPKANLNFQLTGQYRYDLDQFEFALSKFDSKVKGSAYEVNLFNAQVKGNVEVSPNSKALKASELEMEASGGMAGLAVSEIKFSAPKLQANLTTNEISLDGVALNARGKKDNDDVVLKIDAPKLNISKQKASGANIVGQAKLTGPQRNMDAKFSLSGIEGTQGIVQIKKAVVELDGKQGDSAIKGTITTPLTANLETKIVELNKLVADLNVANPSLPQKAAKLPINGNVSVDYGKQTLTSDLATKFDESTILAKVGLTKFTPPSYFFDVNIDRFNVDKYFPPDNDSKEKPLDFSALKGLNANGKLSIHNLVVSNIKASEVNLEMKVANGKADVSSMTAHLYQGSLNGLLSVNANNNHVAVKQQLTGVSVGPLIKDVMNKDLIEGKGNVSLNVTSAGNTTTAIKKGLNGTASANLKDGAVKGINLAQSFRNLKSLLGKKDAEQGTNKQEKTDFSELTGSFTIKNGVAHNEDLSAKSPFFRLSGNGDIDIGNNTINYLTKATVVNTSAGQGGKDLNDLKGLTVPVRVTGSLDSPHYHLEVSKLALQSVKQKLQEKLVPQEKSEEKKKDFDEKKKELANKLRGIFKH